MFQTKFAKYLKIVVVVFLLSCSYAIATSQNLTETPNETSNLNDEPTNYNCPEDCQCVLAKNTHKPFLHAKCSSLKGLKSEEPLHATLPIHSMDLSYLSLSRLSHALEKLPDLTSIDLSHNELHEFGHLGRRIKKLNLKHNRITSSKLSKLPQHIQVLNLKHNDVTYLPLEMKKLHNLQTLELSHNQINCSCETLEVRNWLQEKNVFMEHPVKCSYPREYKGKSWLQVKQAEVCEKEKRGWHPDEDDNELMLGDQPFEGSGLNEDEDELGKAFIPVDKVTTKSLELNEIEGSGDLSETHLNLDLVKLTTQGPENLMARSHNEENPSVTDIPEEHETINDDDNEDGSGSGGGILFTPNIHIRLDNPDEFDGDAKDLDSKPLEEPVNETAQQVFNRHMNFLKPAIDAIKNFNKDDNDEQKPSEETPQESAQDIFNRHMGIFEGSEAEKDNEENIAPTENDDGDNIAPVVHHEDLIPIVDTTEGMSSSENEEIKQANMGNAEEDNSIYFLLAVIALIVVGLLLFVAIKRCRASNANPQDAENPRQVEMLNMEKKNPGKPLKNGNEHLPLIGEKTKADLAKPISGSGKKSYDTNDAKDGPTQQEPLMNANGNSNGKAPVDEEAVPSENQPSEGNPHEYYPISPRYPRPQSPRASKYAQYPQGEPNNNEPETSYSPSSPKSGRYSPVYSPETGRVKIKLTETPRPKTPMLVTRSKSNAGDIITTPVRPEQVHAPGANGQLVH